MRIPKIRRTGNRTIREIHPV
jgi:hypothetical protein